MSEYFSTKSTSTDQWLGSKVTGDDPDKWRFVVEADGKIRWAQGGSSNSDVILQRSNFSQLNPSDPRYWAFPILTLYRGDGTTAGDLQIGTIRLKDSGTIIKWYPDFHTELDIKPDFEPTGYRTHLYCTTVNPNDRRTGPLDPMLSTDYAFFVEKDFKTFGFVGTSSDPEKGMGGGAIQMGQGFTGKYCPPMFNLTGTMTIPDDATAQQLYNHGTTLPGTGNERDIFYNTTDQTIYQYGVTGSGWRPISTAGKIDGYPKGTTLPPSGEYEQWFYKINADQPNQLYQYTKNDDGIYAWRPRFNNVQSYDYDTLFLMRADYEHLGDPIRLANLHLGGLTATNAIYVDQIKHLDGSNWNFSGFDQSLNTTNDAVFNSVKVISADGNPAHGAAVKVGDNTYDYLALNYDGTYGYVSAHNRALYLSGDNGITFGSNINFNNKTFSNYLGSLGSGTPSSSTYLRGDGTWATLPTQQWTAGSVSSVSAPLTISSNILSLPQASGSTNGYLSATDWNTFNSKYGSGSSPSFGNLSCGTVNCGNIASTGTLTLSNNTNGYLWNNGGYIRQSGGYGFVADGTITAGGSITTNGTTIQGTTGRNWFKDSERSDGTGLRVGAAWGMYGIYAENGAAVVGGQNGINFQNGLATLDTSGNMYVNGQSSVSNVWIRGSWLNSSSTLYIGGASGAAVTMYMNGNVNPTSESFGLGTGSGNRWAGISAINGYFNGISISDGGALNFNTYGNSDWAYLGAFRFNDTYNGQGIEVKGTYITLATAFCTQ